MCHGALKVYVGSVIFLRLTTKNFSTTILKIYKSNIPLLSLRIFKCDVVEPQPFSGSHLLHNESEIYINVPSMSLVES